MNQPERHREGGEDDEEPKQLLEIRGLRGSKVAPSCNELNIRRGTQVQRNIYRAWRCCYRSYGTVPQMRQSFSETLPWWHLSQMVSLLVLWQHIISQPEDSPDSVNWFFCSIMGQTCCFQRLIIFDILVKIGLLSVQSLQAQIVISCWRPGRANPASSVGGVFKALRHLAYHRADNLTVWQLDNIPRKT